VAVLPCVVLPDAGATCVDAVSPVLFAIAAYFARSKRSSSITFAQADANARTKSPEASVDA
jgi:hypothetical protein